MTRFAVLCTALAMAVMPSAGSAWRAWNQHDVYPVSEGVFEVVSEVGSGATDFWCGAGDYAYRALRTKGVQRVYIWRAIGPSVTKPGKKAVQFSLTPPSGADTSSRISLSVKAVGDNLRAAMAQQYCFDGDADDPFFRRF